MRLKKLGLIRLNTDEQNIYIKRKFYYFKDSICCYISRSLGVDRRK